MDHADVLDRLATAFSEPGQLSSIDADQSAEGQELRRHLETCDDCRHELEAWRLTSEVLAVATPDSFRAPPRGPSARSCDGRRYGCRSGKDGRRGSDATRRSHAGHGRTGCSAAYVESPRAVPPISARPG